MNKIENISSKKQSFLAKKLDLIQVDSNKNMQIFFNLFYSLDGSYFVFKDDIKATLSKCEQDIYEVCSIVLSCNKDNQEAFLLLPSFKEILSLVSKDSNSLNQKSIIFLIKAFQASILYYLDSKDFKLILPCVISLCDKGIINFHTKRCIISSLNINTKSSIRKNESFKKVQKPLKQHINSFSTFSIEGSSFQKELLFAQKGKQILKSFESFKGIEYFFKDLEPSSVLLLGGGSVGKNTLLKSMFYDCVIKEQIFTECVAPTAYLFGANSLKIKFFCKEDLASLSLAPNKSFVENIKNLCEKFELCYSKKVEDINPELFKQEVYDTNKIDIVSDVQVNLEHDILRYVNFINTPALPAPTLRHLQIDSYLQKSSCVLYLLNLQEDFKNSFKYICSVLFKENIQKIFIVFTKFDKANLTSAKIKQINLDFLNSISNYLASLTRSKDKYLNKISIHYTAANIAFLHRKNKDTKNDIGFDILSSGIPKLELELFDFLFKNQSRCFQNEILYEILTLQKEILELQKKGIIEEYDKAKAKSIIEEISTLGKRSTHTLPSKYSKFHVSLKNLKDNLYAQFVASLNFSLSKTKDATFSSKRLKQSSVDGLKVSLVGLQDILKTHFEGNADLNLLLQILKPDSKHSLHNFIMFPSQKNILNAFSKHLNSIIKDRYSISRSNIIVEHFSSKLDLILKDEIAKNDFKDNKILDDIKASFEYYFMILEGNLDSVFNTRIDYFKSTLDNMIAIFLACFVEIFSQNQKDVDSKIKKLGEVLK